MPKHINALFCLKKKRAARTKDRSLHRVPIRACGKSAWNPDQWTVTIGVITLGVVRNLEPQKLNFSYRLLMLCITVFCRFILRALIEAIQPCWLSFMVLYFVFVCGRLVTEREKQLLASKQYTNLIHEQKRIDAEIDSKVRVIGYGHQSNHACALFSGHISMIISESVVLVFV